MRTRRRLGALLLVLAATAAGPLAGTAAAPAQPAPLMHKLARALAVPHVARSRSAALAVDLTSGATLFARNVGRPLIPASTEKLLVTYAALTTLGPSYRIRTDVLGRGQLHGSTWRGNLILKGRGDPSLATADLEYLAARVRAAGVRRVTGRIVGDESHFDSRRTAPGWKRRYYINESPPLSALAVDRARVVGGAVSRHPALAAASAFRRLLRARGVSVAGRAAVGKARPRAQLLASAFSPPLWRLLRFMGLESDNFTAELLLKQLGTVGGSGGTTAAGATVVRRVLAMNGIPLRGARIVDGSGLSGLNRLTARGLAALLHAAWANPSLRPAFRATLPVAGRTGTLAHRMRRSPARGKVLAKTGTTSSASALAGFVQHRFLFAILQNGHPVSHWWARRAQDRFVAVLAQQRR